MAIDLLQQSIPLINGLKSLRQWPAADRIALFKAFSKSGRNHYINSEYGLLWNDSEYWVIERNHPLDHVVRCYALSVTK